MELNKAAGSENIILELLKNGCRTQKQKLYKSILMIWNNEQLAQQWNEGIICPVYQFIRKVTDLIVITIDHLRY
jgi:hypothetical protein